MTRHERAAPEILIYYGFKHAEVLEISADDAGGDAIEHMHLQEECRAIREEYQARIEELTSAIATLPPLGYEMRCRPHTQAVQLH